MNLSFLPLPHGHFSAKFFSPKEYALQPSSLAAAHLSDH